MTLSVTHQDRTAAVDAALAWLLEQPGSGVRRIPGRVLRFAFSKKGAEFGNRVIESCVPDLLERSGLQLDEYFLTLDGLLLVSNPRPPKILGTILRLVAERYQRPGGLAQRQVLWSDIRAAGRYRSEDFTLAWHVFQVAMLGQGGGRLQPAALDERAPGYDYDFWLDAQQLEHIANHPTVDAWTGFLRARRMANAAPPQQRVESASVSTTLDQDAVIAEMVELLYKFLPASGAPITFGTIAKKVGVENEWLSSGGQSKTHRVRELIVAVYSRHRERFPVLIKEIVGSSLNYRRVKKNPLTREEVDQLNSHLFDLGLRIDDLRRDSFLARLPRSSPQDPAGAAQAGAGPSSAPKTEGPAGPTTPSERDVRTKLEGFRKRFLELSDDENRQRAGRLLQDLLTDLFSLFALEPESAFRVIGEEIDGSFYFDSNIYLLEAKWTRDPVSSKELYAFHMKVTGKSDYTRGVFLSINGYTSEAIAAVATGKSQRVVMIDGAHLFRVLSGELDLASLVKRVVRRLVERGQAYVPVAELVE